MNLESSCRSLLTAWGGGGGLAHYLVVDSSSYSFYGWSVRFAMRHFARVALAFHFMSLAALISVLTYTGFTTEALASWLHPSDVRPLPSR